MGTTEIEIKTILETKNTSRDQSRRTEKEIALKLTGRPGKKTKQDKDITGHIYIKCSIPPLQVVSDTEKGRNVVVEGLMGNKIMKLNKGNKVVNIYQLPPFEYENDKISISTINALWFAQLSKLAYQKWASNITTAAFSLFGIFLSFFPTFLFWQSRYLGFIF